MNKKIFAANWKMYLDEVQCIDFVKKINDKKSFFIDEKIILFPPSTCIRSVKDNLELENIKVGMQDCSIYWEPYALTGGVSVRSINVDYCMAGHSETRNITINSKKMTYDNQYMGLKINNIIAAGVNGIFCVGETLDELKNLKTKEVIKNQLSVLKGETKDLIYGSKNDYKFPNLIIAYEPVWSIGSGKIPSMEEIFDILNFINIELKTICPNANIKLLYGGSVNEHNVEELSKIELLDGFLIGGASSNFESFYKLINKIK